MTVLDHEIDDLLEAFRADEGLLDDATRLRIWARVCDDVPDAPEALDALAPPATVRRLRRPRHRVLAVAASILVLLVIAGVALRPGPGSDDDTVTAGTTESEVAVPGLADLADEIATRAVTELGSTPDASYAHVVLELTATSADGVPGETLIERWISRDGTGRIISDSFVDTKPATDVTYDEPDDLNFDGPLTVAEVLELPDDPDAVEAAFVAAAGEGATARDVVVTVVDALSYQGIPAAARAGMLRFLDRLGFAPVPAPDLTSDVLRVEGSGPGMVVRADIDRRTGAVLARTWVQPSGSADTRTVTTSDLQPDTQGE